MAFASRFKQRKSFVILVALVAAPLLATLNAAQSSHESVSTETKQGGESSDPFGLQRATPKLPTLPWSEVQATRTAKIVRVRFQIKATGTGGDEPMEIVPTDRSAIFLYPQQEGETKSHQRFEVAIVGKARIKVERLGLYTDYFENKWIEVTGVCRHYIEPWAHGDVSVSQFLVNDLDMIEVHTSNWEGRAFE